jgi:hypothetical protein
LAGVAIQLRDALRGLAASPGSTGRASFSRWRASMALGGGFELGGLTLEVGAGPALALRGVAGQFDAVNGEHLAADESLPVAQVQHLGEEAGDVFAQAGDKVGNRW